MRAWPVLFLHGSVKLLSPQLQLASAAYPKFYLYMSTKAVSQLPSVELRLSLGFVYIDTAL
jgi:hypothetical protein